MGYQQNERYQSKTVRPQIGLAYIVLSFLGTITLGGGLVAFFVPDLLSDFLPVTLAEAKEAAPSLIGLGLFIEIVGLYLFFRRK